MPPACLGVAVCLLVLGPDDGAPEGFAAAATLAESSRPHGGGVEATRPLGRETRARRPGSAPAPPASPPERHGARPRRLPAWQAGPVVDDHRASPAAAEVAAAEERPAHWGRLLLRVQSEADQRLESFRVRLERSPGGAEPEAWELPAAQLAREGDRHALDLDAGRYLVTVSALGWIASTPELIGVGGGVEVALEVELSRAVELAGRVELPATLGSPEVVLELRHQPLAGQPGAPSRWEASPPLEPGGAFTLRDVPPGLYQVRAGLRADPAWRSDWARCELRGEGEPSLPLAPLRLRQLEPGLTGVVRGRDRFPVAGVEVRVGDEVVETDAEGAFTLYALEGSLALVELSSPGFVTARRTVSLGVAPPALEVELTPTGEVRGSVVGAGAGARVVLLHRQGPDRFDSRAQLTDAAGRYAFSDLPAGSYVVLVGPRVDAQQADAGTWVEVGPGQRQVVQPLEPL